MGEPTIGEVVGMTFEEAAQVLRENASAVAEQTASDEANDDPCAGWHFDAAGNVVCPSCGTIDPETGTPAVSGQPEADR